MDESDTSNTNTDDTGDASDAPGNVELQQVLVKYLKKKQKRRSSEMGASLHSKLTACQRCLQLLLDYRVYQVRGVASSWRVWLAAGGCG